MILKIFGVIAILLVSLAVQQWLRPSSPMFITVHAIEELPGGGVYEYNSRTTKCKKFPCMLVPTDEVKGRIVSMTVEISR